LDGDAPGPYETTTDSDGRYRFDRVPAGTYPHLIARGPAYAEAVTEDVVVSGTTRTDIRLRRNWADINAGAAVVRTDTSRANGCGPSRIADGNRMRGWAADITGRDEGYIDIALPQAVR